MKQIKLLLVLFFVCTITRSQEIPKWKASDLKQYMDTVRTPVVLSFWASFCQPCLEEMPYFQELSRKYAASGLQLVLVNLDMKEAYPKKIRNVAKKFNITYPIYFLDETNADLFCPVVDPTWSGAIPASLFLHNAKGYRTFYEDQLSEKSFEAALKKMLDL